MSETYAQQLADALHEEQCDNAERGCAGKVYRPGSSHHTYYAKQAEHLIEKLEPIIGIANVQPVVLAVLQEVY